MTRRIIHPKSATTTQCQYHYSEPLPNERIALIQVNHNPKAGEWQPLLWCCDECRRHLRGSFRYAQGTP